MIISLKKMAIYGTVVILASITVTWGLKTLTYREVFNPVEVETTYGPIKLAMSLDKSKYGLGESVNVTLRLTNIDNKTIMLVFCSPLKVDFRVCDEIYQTIYTYSGTHGTIAIGSSVILESGESFGRTLTWDQQAEPGIYFIFGRTGQGSILIKPYEQEIETVETPKIEIEIKP